MVFAAVMAGGSGSRMGCTDIPKQFLTLGSKPIIVHTVEKFFIHPGVDRIVVMCPRQWVNYTRELLTKFLPDSQEKVFVAAGGKTRNNTLENAISYIYENFAADESSVLLTHDAVRPFVTHRIITENIAAAAEYGSCNTVVPATDTLAVSSDGKFIDEIPNRNLYFHGQTPQSFNLKALSDTLSDLTDDEKSALTDACMIFSIRGSKVFMVRGEAYNIKITWPDDLAVAEKLLEREGQDDKHGGSAQ